MADYVFEVITTTTTKALRDEIKDFIEGKNKDYIHKIEIIGDYRLKFRGRCTGLGKVMQIRGWFKNKIDDLEESEHYTQVWYDRMGKKTRKIMVPNPDPPPDEIEEEVEYEEPSSEGEEIIIGTLGVTPVG